MGAILGPEIGFRLPMDVTQFITASALPWGGANDPNFFRADSHVTNRVIFEASSKIMIALLAGADLLGNPPWLFTGAIPRRSEPSRHRAAPVSG